MTTPDIKKMTREKITELSNFKTEKNLNRLRENIKRF